MAPAIQITHSRITAYLILKNIPKREWSFLIGRRRAVLGRSPHADIPVPARFHGISRQHAELWTDRYGIWVHDLGSERGTNVNGVWVDHVPQAGLVIGDRIWFGDVEADVVADVKELAQFHCESYEADDFTAAPSGEHPMSRTVVHQLSRAEIDVLLWLGRGYENDIEIGSHLHRSPHTVRNELKSIFHKLNLHSRAEVMGWLRRTCPV